MINKTVLKFIVKLPFSVLPALVSIAILFNGAIYAFSAEFSCTVTQKYDFGKIYTETEIDKWKFSAKIEEFGNKAFVSRCSFTTSQGAVTCDRYKVDRVEYDENVNIKKYYIFRSQYNIQVFQNLSFIEDNGRGGISYGKCILISP